MRYFEPSHLDRAIQRLQQNTSQLEILYSKVIPIDRCTSDQGSDNRPPVVRVTVLDSSFNPPTRAHLALALLSTPDISDTTLLLLSVRNADKQLKTGDAPYTERLEMLAHFADDLARSQIEANWPFMPKCVHENPTSSSDQSLAKSLWPVILTAAIDEPTFVGKSTVLHHALPPYWPSLVRDWDGEHRHEAFPRFQFTFLMGWDTITRFFDPKFYPSPEGMSKSLEKFFFVEKSSILCARRPKASFRRPGDVGTEPADEQEESIFLQSGIVKPYVDAGLIKMINIGASEGLISSTRLRESLKGTVNTEWVSLTTPAIVSYIQEQQVYSAPWTSG
ncbi:uncharacterized protein EI90DRAFT_3037526 [Cantharellus anzutake]|uniref:uncharacterized protein n=1 Tax=Cantharellus anzutake TaxID=1750568 RepID=UPI001906E8F0|nr:uncharacterized protein EI90DRAFT_3037526 [Cantharellus anzutake]KAF8339707.1 hypothetical protein EI90DRAFT_3037526 [Cantharellus anzutake]